VKNIKLGYNYKHMDNTILISIFALILAGLIFVILLLLKKKTPINDAQSLALLERLAQQSEKLSQLAAQNTEMRQELDKKLSETHRASQGQFEQTTR